MRLIAELTMPNNNSWNGRWSGDKNIYTKVFLKSCSKKNLEYIGNYYYNFGDGWGANVEIRKARPRVVLLAIYKEFSIDRYHRLEKENLCHKINISVLEARVDYLEREIKGGFKK